MALYGLANFASDFNRVRDDSLLSGFRAKQAMRDDWLGDCQMPDRMLATDVDALGNSIKYDTLNNGYDDMVQTGLNTAQLGAQQSGVNLRKAQADNTVAGLRSQAIRNGMTNESDIAGYVAQNVDPAEAATNPYLSTAAWGSQQDAYRKMLGTGTALGGTAGDVLAGQAISGLGYGLTPSRDANGNLIFTDAQGRTTGAFGPAGQIPAGMAIYGEVGPAQQAAENAERMRAEAAKTTATLAQKQDYGQLRYDTQQQIADQNNYTRWLGYGNKYDVAALHGQKGKPSALGAGIIGGGPVTGAGGGLHAWANGYQGSGLDYGSPGTPGAPGMNGAPTASGSAPAVGAGYTSNPFESSAPSTAAAAMPTTAPAVQQPVAPLPPGLEPPTGPAAYVPAHLTLDAARRLAASSTATPSAPVAPAVSQYMPAAQTGDPEKDFGTANTEYEALRDKLRQMDRDAGPMTVYGPTNAPPGWAKARDSLATMLAQASDRRDAAERAANNYRYAQQQQQQMHDAREREANDNAAAQALLSRYLPTQAAK